MVVTADQVARLSLRRSPKLTTPDDECVLKQASLFEVLYESGRRLIDFLAAIVERLAEVRARVPMMIPVGVVKLHEAATTFDQSPRKQAVPGVRRLRDILDVVALQRLF